MKRTISVEATCSFEFEIDDDVVSTWDGAKILEVLEKRKDVEPPLYTPRATIETLLMGLGVELCVEGRDIDRIDGWADFPREAASGSPYSTHWELDRVHIGDPR